MILAGPPYLPDDRPASEEEIERHTVTMYALRGLLHAAGIDCRSVVWIANRYWPTSTIYDDVRSPWLVAFTDLGPLVIGWRKNVISIDWRHAQIDVDGRDVVSSEKVTHGRRSCHAWGWRATEQTLARLWRKRDEHPRGCDCQRCRYEADAPPF